MLFARCAVGQLGRGADPKIILKVGPVIQSGRPGYRGRSQSFWFWGKHGLSFDIGGAGAFRSDVPNGEVHVLDAGHFGA